VPLSLDQAVRFEPWPGTLCCVLEQDTLITLIVPLSPPRSINRYRQIVGELPAIDQQPVKGEWRYPRPLCATETGISSSSYEPVSSMASLFLFLEC